MGKKKRMIAYPQKFGRKFASHPRVATPQSNQEQIEELPSITEEVPTPILEEVAAELQTAPETAPEVEKPEPKKAAPKATTTRKKKAATKRKASTARAKKTTSKK